MNDLEHIGREENIWNRPFDEEVSCTIFLKCSDAYSYDSIGSRYTWLKMEIPDVEGIRLALLDPESRLRWKDNGPPGGNYPRIERLRIRRADYYDDIEIPFSPCLTTLIGGRGSGKSTAIEYLRYVFGRERIEDFGGALSEDVKKIHAEVMEKLKQKGARNYGQTKGTLLPDFELEADIVVNEQRYLVRRTSTGVKISRFSGTF